MDYPVIKIQVETPDGEVLYEDNAYSTELISMMLNTCDKVIGDWRCREEERREQEAIDKLADEEDLS